MGTKIYGRKPPGEGGPRASSSNFMILGLDKGIFQMCSPS